MQFAENTSTNNINAEKVLIFQPSREKLRNGTKMSNTSKISDSSSHFSLLDSESFVFSSFHAATQTGNIEKLIQLLVTIYM